jgi:hypothetical protein
MLSPALSSVGAAQLKTELLPSQHTSSLSQKSFGLVDVQGTLGNALCEKPASGCSKG